MTLAYYALFLFIKSLKGRKEVEEMGNPFKKTAIPREDSEKTEAMQGVIMAREQLKEDNKKNNRPRRSYKGVLRKFFWFGFFAFITMGIISIMRTVSQEVAIISLHERIKEVDKIITKIPTEAAEEEEAFFINEHSVGVYATEFVKEFYTWNSSSEKADERITRLQPYFATGILANGGYDVARIDTNSIVLSSDLWKVDIVGDEIEAIIRVTYELRREEKKKKKTVNTLLATENRYLKVVLAVSGDSFKVIKMPILVPAPVEVEYTPVEKEPLKADDLVVDEVITGEVRAFIETFFKVATSGTREELIYYTKNEVESLRGLYTLVSVGDIVTYKEGEGYRVVSDILLLDSSTSAEVYLRITAGLVKEQDRFILSDINY